MQETRLAVPGLWEVSEFLSCFSPCRTENTGMIAGLGKVWQAGATDYTLISSLSPHRQQNW